MLAHRGTISREDEAAAQSTKILGKGVLCVCVFAADDWRPLLLTAILLMDELLNRFFMSVILSKP